MFWTQTYYELETWFWPIFKKFQWGPKKILTVKAIYYISRCYDFDSKSLKEIQLGTISAKTTFTNFSSSCPLKKKKALIFLVSTFNAIKIGKTSISYVFFFKGHGEGKLVKVFFAENVPNGTSFSDFESKS